MSERLRNRIEQLENPSGHRPTTLLEELVLATQQQELEQRLAFFWWTLRRAGMCNDVRIPGEIRAAAHSAYRKHWAYYDELLHPSAAAYLVKQIQKQGLTDREVWVEFAGDLLFPVISVQQPPASPPDQTVRPDHLSARKKARMKPLS